MLKSETSWLVHLRVTHSLTQKQCGDNLTTTVDPNLASNDLLISEVTIKTKDQMHIRVAAVLTGNIYFIYVKQLHIPA